jgi:hypothetical protein
MRIEKPVVIVGTGRCGSTMLHRLLAHHEALGWLSTFNEVFPSQPWLGHFSDLYRQPIFSRRVKHLPFFPKPFEAYRFWEHYLPGFSRREEPLTAEDVAESRIGPVRHAVSGILRAQGKERFLVKVTGWSRIAYFDRIFPDAVFVLLNREIRSIVSSWVQAGWLDVTSGLDTDSWQWGHVPAHYRRFWEDLGGGPILSAAVKIRLDLDDIRRNMDRFPERCYELQYEDLVTRPEVELRTLLDFCQLDWTDDFARVVNEHTFHNPIDKWRSHLPTDDAERVLEFFRRADAHPRDETMLHGLPLGTGQDVSGTSEPLAVYERAPVADESPRTNVP